ncbi:Ig-like domain-containing protein [Rarobacter faecitabidus]|uniref:Fibronectin type III domain protein n=1 Tax=Rarobacter faecitabidus TaxID=13243 RepID=A0A542ZTQ9_RARFA|nr:cadherin-like domain-containing protein [Rarobacter faecitabidus]TQL63748.1 hypothetical protein FB461_0221 [Rarobacter faecitabidus]
MTTENATTRSAPRRKTIALVAVLAVAAAAVGVAFAVSRPADVQAIQVHESTVWINRDAAAGRSLYGSLNVDLMELTTAQETTRSFPEWIAQDGTNTVMLHGERYFVVDPARPAPVDEDTAFGQLPAPISDVETAGDYIVLRDENERVYATTIADLAAGRSLTALNETTADGTTERIVAASVDQLGRVTALTQDGVLITEDLTLPDAEASRTPLEIELPQTPARQADLTTFAEHWALLTRETPDSPAALWIDGTRIADVGADAVLASPTLDARLVVATGTGYDSYDAQGESTSVQLPSAATSASVAVPEVLADGCVLGAWTSAGALIATTCDGSFETLNQDALAQSDNRIVFQRVGSTIVLSDITRGTAWVFNGRAWDFVPSTLTWEIDDVADNDQRDDTLIDAPSPQPPIPPKGENAEFGVRPGAVTRVPVLIGASDPNPGDVISIVPGTVQWAEKNASFGAPRLVEGNTAVVVDATGADDAAATLRFKITDGTAGHERDAVVRVSTHDPAAQQSAPREVRMGSQGAPRLTAGPGAVITADVLKYWVDPDGDALSMTASTPAAGTVVALPEGRLVFSAPDEASAAPIEVPYVVTDALGESIAGALSIEVRADAQPTIVPAAVTGVVGRAVTIPVADLTTGVARATRLLPITNNDPALSFTVSQAPATIQVTASEPGEYTFTYGVTAGQATAEGTVRLSVVDSDDATVTANPITVHVSPGNDARVDLLSTVQNPGGAAIGIKDVTPLAGASPTLAESGVAIAEFSGSSLRVAADETAGGATLGPQGALAGRFSFTVIAQSATGGTTQTRGFGTVFLVPEPLNAQAIAVPDTIEIAAGQTGDLDVLRNDVIAAGADLVLDPRPIKDTESIDLAGNGLAFASGSKLRILAPTTPGEREISYYVYPRGRPDKVTRGTATVFVVEPPTTSGLPIPQLTGRLFQRGQTVIDLSQAGDAIPSGATISAISGIDQSRAHARIGEDLTSVIVESKGSDASPSAITFSITVTSGSATATVPVIVAVIDASPQPVAFNDYRYEPAGNEIVVTPLTNDSIPDGQSARITKVERITTEIDQASQTARRVATALGTLAPDGESFTAPVDEGVSAYQYTVVTGLPNEDGIFDPSREIGQLIGETTAFVIVHSSDETIPQFPRISDSYVTAAAITGIDPSDGAETFDIDVYTGKVVWSGESLKLSLLSDDDSASADGATRVRGKLGATERVVPFELRVAGSNPVVVSYGFVHLPRSSVLKPELREPSRIYTLNEGSTRSVDLAQAIVPLVGRSLNVTGVTVGGQRKDAKPAPASCTLSGTVVTYAAGTESAATRDDCYVRVAWAGVDDSEVTLGLSFEIVLENSPPEFTCPSRTIEVQPKQGGDVDLKPCIAWRQASGLGDVAKLRVELVDEAAAPLPVRVDGTRVVVDEVPATTSPTQFDVLAQLVGPDGAYTPAVTMQVTVRVLPASAVNLTFLPITLPTLKFDGFEGGGGQPSLTANIFADHISAALDQYYGWDNGRIEYDACQEVAALTCQAADSGKVLTLTVDPGTPEAPTTSFQYEIGFTVWDSGAASTRTINSGRGVIKFRYESVPARPAIEVTSVRGTQFTLRVTPRASGRGDVTECRVLRNGTVDKTAPVQGGECMFTVTVPRAFESYAFTAQVKAGDSGWSAQSEAVERWGYEPPPAPTVQWKPTPGGQTSMVDVKITNLDPRKVGRIELEQAGDVTSWDVSASRTSINAELQSVPSAGQDIKVRAFARSNGDVPGDDPSLPSSSRTARIYGIGGVRVESVTRDGQGDSFTATVAIDGYTNYYYGWLKGSGTCKAEIKAAGNNVTQNATLLTSSDRNKKVTITFCARAVDATALSSRGATGIRSEDTYGDVARVNEEFTIVVTPDNAEVVNAIKYKVEGTLDSGFTVRLDPKTVTIGDVTFTAEIYDESILNPNDHVVSVYLTAEGGYSSQNTQRYRVGPASTHAAYKPGGWSAPSVPSSASCTAPVPDGGGGFTDAGGGTVNFSVPSFSSIKGSDWEWTLRIEPPSGSSAAPANYDLSSGPTFSWSFPQGNDYEPGTYTVTAKLTWKNSLSELSSSGTEITRTYDCPEPPP